MTNEMQKKFKMFSLLAFIAEIILYVVGAMELFTIFYTWADSNLSAFGFSKFTTLSVYLFLFFIAFLPVTLLIRYARIKIDMRLAKLTDEQATATESGGMGMPASPPMG